MFYKLYNLFCENWWDFADAKLVNFGVKLVEIGGKRGIWRKWRNWWDSAPPDLAGGGPLINIFFGGILQNVFFFSGSKLVGFCTPILPFSGVLAR